MRLRVFHPRHILPGLGLLALAVAVFVLGPHGERVAATAKRPQLRSAFGHPRRANHDQPGRRSGSPQRKKVPLGPQNDDRDDDDRDDESAGRPRFSDAAAIIAPAHSEESQRPYPTGWQPLLALSRTPLYLTKLCLLI